VLADSTAQAQWRGARRLVGHCAGLTSAEHALVVCDPSTRAVAAAIVAAAQELGARVERVETPALSIHGEEPSPEVAAAMAAADVVFGVTAMSLAHTQARCQGSQRGMRFLSLPDYSLDVLAGAALEADFHALGQPARRLAAVLTHGTGIGLRTQAGTDLVLDITGRTGNAAPGFCDEPGSLASPPDAEANVAVVEHRTRGTIVVDGSIPCPELGLLETPLTLQVRDGRVTGIEGERGAVLEAILDRPGHPGSRVVAELGIGLNPLARLTGSMLEDEGALGTVHIGIGANSALGGINHVPFHLDHVLRRPTVTVDGRTVMRDGVLDQL